MERIYTKDGFDTHAWKPVMDIQTFVYSFTQKDVNYQQWFNLTSNPSNARNSIKYLTDVRDLHFIDVEKERKLFSFQNGIYETSIWDETTQRYIDKWYPHIKTNKTVEKPEDLFEESLQFSSADLCPKRSACKYFDQKFNNYENVDDWYNIPTPIFQSILDYQKFPEDVCRWMYTLICGRLLHDVGDLDEWQVIPFLKGKAGTGKSTILTKVCKEFFHTLDVGVLSNNCEKKFGLSAIKDKLLFIAPEIKSNIGLEQCDFQTMISGEDTSVAEKFKTASAVKWKVPGALAGNEPPNYKDNQGSVGRRVVVFDFATKVKKGDMQLGKKLFKEIPILIKKGNLAYLESVNNHGKSDVWNTLPFYFKKTQQDLSEQTNSLANFLGSDKIVYQKGLYCRQKVFVQVFNEHVRENGLPKVSWTRDFFEGPMEDRGIEYVKENRLDERAGRKYNCRWFRNIDLVYENEIAKDDLE